MYGKCIIFDTHGEQFFSATKLDIGPLDGMESRMGLLKRRIIESEEPKEEPPMVNTVDTDIVESLRYVAQSAKPVDAGQMRAAADEIERLRITDSEREAVQQAFDFVCGMERPDEWAVAALRGLLERMTL